jgi:hypothetical protein
MTETKPSAAPAAPLVPAVAANDQQRAVEILARSIFKELIRNGYKTPHLVALTTEILDLAADALRLEAANSPQRETDAA